VHPLLSVESGDTVILSSRIIPGNEPMVTGMICSLLRRGAQVHSVLTDVSVHTSGHAGRSELRRLLELVRPCCFLPIHGTLHHLLRHAELARAAGVPDVLVAENGTSVTLDQQGLHLGGRVPHGSVAVDNGGETLPPETQYQRTELGRRGIVAVSIVLDGHARPLADPRLTVLGVPGLNGQSQGVSLVVRDLTRAVRRLRRADPRTQAFAEHLRRVIRRRIVELTGARPGVELHVIVAED
jgi:ribonuclease J